MCFGKYQYYAIIRPKCDIYSLIELNILYLGTFTFQLGDLSTSPSCFNCLITLVLLCSFDLCFQSWDIMLLHVTSSSVRNHPIGYRPPLFLAYILVLCIPNDILTSNYFTYDILQSGNRYGMPRGSRFYRVRVRPARAPPAAHPPCCDHRHRPGMYTHTYTHLYITVYSINQKCELMKSHPIHRYTVSIRNVNLCA